MPPFSLCRYRGQKTRFATAILSHMPISPETRFWDVCTGSGAIALAAAEQGVKPQNIMLVEKGAWGLFWVRIANSTFSTERFAHHLAQLPPSQADVTDYMKALFRQPCPLADAPYIFLLLQSASVHGSAFGYAAKDGMVIWTGTYSCAKYFVPTETSVRRYPTRVMPKTDELMKRVRRVIQLLQGASVIHGDIAEVPVPEPGTLIYVDPPYPGTKGYSTDTKVEFPRIQAWVKRCVARGGLVYVSGYEAWPEAVETWSVGGSRMGGAGAAKAQREELLMRIAGAALPTN